MATTAPAGSRGYPSCLAWFRVFRLLAYAYEDSLYILSSLKLSGALLCWDSIDIAKGSFGQHTMAHFILRVEFVYEIILGSSLYEGLGMRLRFIERGRGLPKPYFLHVYKNHLQTQNSCKTAYQEPNHGKYGCAGSEANIQSIRAHSAP